MTNYIKNITKFRLFIVLSFSILFLFSLTFKNNALANDFICFISGKDSCNYTASTLRKKMGEVSNEDPVVLAEVDKNPDLEFEVHIRSSFKNVSEFLNTVTFRDTAEFENDVSLLENLNVEGDATFNQVSVGALNLLENSTLNGVGGIDTVTIATFESSLNLSGDVTGFLNNVSIEDGVILGNHFADEIEYEGDFTIDGTFTAGEAEIEDTLNVNSLEIDGTSVDASASEINYLVGLSMNAGGLVFSDGSALTSDFINLYFDNQNNYLGVGTSNPSATLEVAGTLKYDNGYQSSGYVLTSDASGNATWSDVSSTGGPWTLSGLNLYPDATSTNVAIGAVNAGSAKLFVNGNVGIGTSDPSAKLYLTGDLVVSDSRITDVLNPNAISWVEGLIYDESKYSLLVGRVTNNNWDTANVGIGAYNFGLNNITLGNFSLAIGDNNTASANYARVIGSSSTASGANTTVFGYQNTASGEWASVLGGWFNTASGSAAVVAGEFSEASGNSSLAIGTGNEANAWASSAVGAYNTASGSGALSMGYSNTASGDYSTALGDSATASGDNSTAFGYSSLASGSYSTAFGYDTTSSGSYSLAFGREVVSAGNYSVAIGLADMNGATVTQSNTLAILGGKVGIGTTAPAVELDVLGTVNVNSQGRAIQLTNQGWFATGNLGYGILSENANGMQLRSDNAGILFKTGGDNTRVVIDSSGNIGVGTTNPGFILELADDGTGDNAKLGINGTQILYMPDQTKFPGTLVIGDGGQNLTAHWSGPYFGRDNTFIGLSAGSGITSGNVNVAIGNEALSVGNNSETVAIGWRALRNAASSINIGIGPQAGQNLTTSSDNIFIGELSGNSITAGSYDNILIGQQTGWDLSEAFGNIVIGDYAFGGSALDDGNTVIGFAAMNDGSGSNNTTIGYDAGRNSTGGNNIYLGYRAGRNVTTGTNNLIIGYDLSAPSATASNQLYIGGAIYGNLSNGNIGIGNVNPQYKLEVSGTAQATNLRLTGIGSGGSNSTVLALDGSNNVDFIDLSSYDTVSGDDITYSLTAGYIPYANSTSSLADSTVYLTGGNIGIGTTAPTAPLQVFSSSNGYSIKSHGAGYFNTLGASTGLVVERGNIGFGTSSPAGKLHISNNNSQSILRLSPTSTTYYLDIETISRPNEYDYLFNVKNHSGSEITALALQSATGNVGIGTTNPSANLDIYKNASGYALEVTQYNNIGGYGMLLASRSNTVDEPILRIQGGNSLNDILYIGGNEQVGIGTTTPSYKLHVVGSANFYNSNVTTYAARIEQDDPSGYGLLIDTDGNESHEPALRIKNATSDLFFVGSTKNVGIGTTNPSLALDVVGSARFSAVGSGTYANDLNLTADGTLTTASSDKRLKENLQRLEGSLSKVLKLNTYSFNWIDDPTRTDLGLVAQEVHNVLPEVTFVNPTDGYMGINYSRLPAVLISAMQEQQLQIDSISGELQVLTTGTTTPAETATIEVTTENKTVWEELKDVLSFENVLNILKETVFKAKVAFEKGISINDIIDVGNSIAGTLEVPEGTITITAKLPTEYPQAPMIQLTPITKIDGSYWIESSSTKEFTLKLSQAQTKPVKFQWFALTGDNGSIEVEVVETGSLTNEQDAASREEIVIENSESSSTSVETEQDIAGESDVIANVDESNESSASSASLE